MFVASTDSNTQTVITTRNSFFENNTAFKVILCGNNVSSFWRDMHAFICVCWLQGGVFASYGSLDISCDSLDGATFVNNSATMVCIFTRNHVTSVEITSVTHV